MSSEGVSFARVLRRVVVIDDNQDSADAVSLLLSMNGCECKAAYTAESGVALVCESSPDVVLLDVAMPEVDGYEACRRIRSALGRQVFIVALTGSGLVRDKEAALLAGFDAHLLKPADPEDLLSIANGAGVDKGARVHVFPR